jgi:hypothetical protein
MHRLLVAIAATLMLSAPLLVKAQELPRIDDPLRSGASAPADVAVVVGNEQYSYAPAVPYARRDAQAVRDFLVYTRGIPAERIHHLNEASREEILQAIDRALEDLEPGGVLWFYFAGHGVADPATQERLLLGSDVKMDAGILRERAVAITELETTVGATNTAALFLVDACYTGESRSGEALTDTRFAVPTLQEADSEWVTLWSATSGNEVAAPLKLTEHGAFTYFAVGAMRGWADGELDGQPDGTVTLREAREYVDRALRIYQVHNQRPRVVGDIDQWTLTTGKKLEEGPELDVRTAERITRRQRRRTTAWIVDGLLVVGGSAAILAGEAVKSGIRSELESGAADVEGMQDEQLRANTLYLTGYGSLGAAAGLGMTLWATATPLSDNMVPTVGLSLAW